MKKTRTIWAVVLFVLWTAFIFTRSMQPSGLSNEESGRLLSLLEQLLPFELSNHFVRKAAHFVEYAVLGFLGWFVFARRNVAFERLVFAVVTCLLVALCDETIQLFVEGRAGKVPDIWLDMAGVLAGVLVGGVFQTLCRRVKKKGRDNAVLAAVAQKKN